MTVNDIAALPPADAEQRHLVDEILHPDFVEAVHHEFAVRCGNCGTSQPVTLTFGVTGEAGR